MRSGIGTRLVCVGVAPGLGGDLGFRWWLGLAEEQVLVFLAMVHSSLEANGLTMNEVMVFRIALTQYLYLAWF